MVRRAVRDRRDRAGAYRKDWFEDPAEKAAFKAKYGRELAVPETWEEFQDVAEFFQRPDEKRYGCVLAHGPRLRRARRWACRTCCGRSAARGTREDATR